MPVGSAAVAGAAVPLLVLAGFAAGLLADLLAVLEIDAGWLAPATVAFLLTSNPSLRTSRSAALGT